MNILVDTNVLLDFLEDREPFNEAADRLFKKCEENRINGHIAVHSIPNIFYILRKDYTVNERKDMLMGICEIMNVVGIDKSILAAALTNEQFADAPIPAMVPEVFLKQLDKDTL